MSRKQPIVYIWKQVEVTDEHGEISLVHAMVPLLRYHNVAARQFAEGADYVLAEVEERSMASHNQYFAALHQGFENLPEKIQARFPTVQHLRAWLLVEVGCFEEVEFPVDPKTLKRLAAFIRTESPYARLIKAVSPEWGDVLIVRKPRSQAMREMGKREFEDSKKRVLDLLEAMVGVPLGTLMKNAKESARRHDE